MMLPLTQLRWILGCVEVSALLHSVLSNTNLACFKQNKHNKAETEQYYLIQTTNVHVFYLLSCQIRISILLHILYVI